MSIRSNNTIFMNVAVIDLLDRGIGGGRNRGKLGCGGGIIGNKLYICRPFAQRARQPHRGPGAPQSARVDRLRHVSNGLRDDRNVRRTGTAPKPRSRLMPLIR